MSIKILSVHDYASSLGNWLSNKSGDTHQSAFIIYGAEILLGIMLKVVLLFVGSMLLGVPELVAVILLTAGGFRLLTGGAHCTAYYRCLLFSLLIFLGLGYFIYNILPFLTALHRYYLILPLIICLYCVIRWAPMPPKNKPLKSDKDRLARKQYAVAVVYVMMLLLVTAGTGEPWVWGTVTGLFWQSFTLTPIGHQLLMGLDSLLTIKKREGGWKL